MRNIDALPNRVPRSEFVAGRLSLAFCNTGALPTAADRLTDTGTLSAWAARAGHPFERTPDSSDLYRFLDLRKVLQKIFGAIASGLDPEQVALDKLAAMTVPARLAWDIESYRATPVPVGEPIERLRQAIIADASDLLTGDALRRIKRCPAHDCQWLFFDSSRNATRRWCAMEDCGVKHKVQRYRDRQVVF